MFRFVQFAAVAAAYAASSTGAFAQTVEPAQAGLPAAAAGTETASTASGPSVAFTVRQGPPSFIFTKRAGVGLQGVNAALANIADGKRIAAAYKLEEPANAIGAELAAAFAASKGGRLTDAPIAVDKEHRDLLAGNTGRAAYIVDVAPVAINAIYFAFDWYHYGLIYSTNVRVIDVADGTVLASARCVLTPKKTPESPNEGEMLSYGAAGLKAMIGDATKTCTAELKAKLKL